MEINNQMTTSNIELASYSVAGVGIERERTAPTQTVEQTHTQDQVQSLAEPEAQEQQQSTTSDLAQEVSDLEQHARPDTQGTHPTQNVDTKNEGIDEQLEKDVEKVAQAISTASAPKSPLVNQPNAAAENRQDPHVHGNVRNVTQNQSQMAVGLFNNFSNSTRSKDEIKIDSYQRKKAIREADKQQHVERKHEAREQSVKDKALQHGNSADALQRSFENYQHALHSGAPASELAKLEKGVEKNLKTYQSSLNTMNKLLKDPKVPMPNDVLSSVLDTNKRVGALIDKKTLSALNLHNNKVVQKSLQSLTNAAADMMQSVKNITSVLSRSR